ncbi:MAG: glycosyltransferase family 4 protein [Candidatus Kapabacteria bacterium]|nr:glycosyltransferase family 4 protein [Candidatus Kapabacteria bacterium]
MNKNKYDTAIVCGSYGRGGLEFNTVKLASELIKRGNSIVVFAKADTFIAQRCQDLAIPLMNLPKYMKYFDFYNAWRLAFRLKMIACKNIITSFHPDLSLLANTKLINQQLNLIYQQQMHIGRRKKDIFHRIRYSQVDYWVSPLQLLAGDVLRLSTVREDQIRIIPLGVDTEKIKPQIPREEYRKKSGFADNDIVFCIIGRIDSQKGQLTILRAFDKIKQEKNIKLLIVGEKTVGEGEEYYNQLLQFIDEQNLGDRVTITDFEKNVGNVMNAVDCFILASSSEAYGMVTVEAFLSKLPIIASANGGTLELTQNGQYGRLFKPHDVEDLAAAMQEFVQDRAAFISRADKAYDYAKSSFTLDHECKGIESLFR